MQKLLFLSRAAFLLNLCYITGIILRASPISSLTRQISGIIAGGYFLSGIFNLVLLAAYFFLIITNRAFPVPKWLAIFNTLILAIQMAEIVI